MSDEIAENGTANGDVPEIELIIKVTLFVIYVRMRLTRQPAARVAYSTFADFVKRWHLTYDSDVSKKLSPTKFDKCSIICCFRKE